MIPTNITVWFRKNADIATGEVFNKREMTKLLKTTATNNITKPFAFLNRIHVLQSNFH